MKGHITLFSTAAQDWSTPQELFDIPDKIWGLDYTFDCAADEGNAKCRNWSSDSLEIPWEGRVWCNPPYSMAKQFVKKGLEEIAEGRVDLITFLIPARTDTRLWHDLLVPNAEEIVFLRGRVKFGGASNSAPFPSALVTIRRGYTGRTRILWEDLR